MTAIPLGAHQANRYQVRPTALAICTEPPKGALSRRRRRATPGTLLQIPKP